MSYAVPADMLKRFDVRRLGQLVSDDGTQVSAGALSTNANLQAALDDAAGMIDAACLQGGRYVPADLTNLILNLTAPIPVGQTPGTSATQTIQAAAFLIRLNCDLAYGFLVERRGYTQSEAQAQSPGFTRAMSVIGQIESGNLVFNVNGAVQAGMPQNVQLDQNLQLISGVTRCFGDLIVNPANPGGTPITSDRPF